MNQALPNHWITLPLHKLVIAQKGKKPLKLANKPFQNSISYWDIDALEKGVSKKYADPYSSMIARQGDILVVWDGSRSGLIFAGREGAVGSTLMCLTPLAIDHKYLQFYLKYLYPEINNNTTGISIPHVDQNLFYNLQVPIAPIHEQKSIVHIIEENLNLIHQQFKDVFDQLNTIKNFHQSILSKTFSSKSATELQKEKLENVAVVIMGNSPDSSTYNNKGKGTPLINGPTEFGTKPWSTVSLNTIHQYSTSTIVTKTSEIGDLLLCIRGSTTGRTNLAGIRAILGRGVAAIRTKSEYLDQRYLNWFVISKQNEILQHASIGVTTFPSISREWLSNLIIPIPSLSEQKLIVDRIDMAIKSIDEDTYKISEQIKNVEMLKTSILQNAFNGKIYKPTKPERVVISQILEQIDEEYTAMSQLIKSEKQKQKDNIKSFRMKIDKKYLYEYILENYSGSSFSANDLYQDLEISARIYDEFKDNLFLLAQEKVNDWDDEPLLEILYDKEKHVQLLRLKKTVLV